LRKNILTRAALGIVAALAVTALARTAHAADPWNLMPESASAEADEIDGLTYLILWITGVTFVLVEGLLVVFLFKYKRKPGQKSKYTHGNHAVEMAWTVTPAAILVFLALYQMNLWIELKKPRPEKNDAPTKVQILAKQFEWNFRYPGPDGIFGPDKDGKVDDRLTVAALVVPVNHPVNAELRSMDVIHSFFLPNFRFKQDAVPGLTIPFWFKPTKLSADRKHADGRPMMNRNEPPQQIHYWDIVCAELCGNLHTTMGAQLYVVSDADFAKWQNDASSVPGLPAWSVWDRANPMQSQDKVWTRWEWQDKKFDEKGRVLMHPAKVKREPFGKDEKPGGETKQEDM
jgi:cytochrome c oxidase subunit 2